MNRSSKRALRSFSAYSLLMAALYLALVVAFLYAFTPSYFWIFDLSTSLGLSAGLAGCLWGFFYYLSRIFALPTRARKDWTDDLLQEEPSPLRDDHLQKQFNRALQVFIVMGFSLGLTKAGIENRVYPKGSEHPTETHSIRLSRGDEVKYFEPSQIRLLNFFDVSTKYYVFGGIFIFWLARLTINRAESREAGKP